MKKKVFLMLIVIIIMAIVAITCVACSDDDEIIGGVLTKDCAVRDFQTLRKVFPKNLLLPSEYTNEIIFVKNSDFINLENNIEHQIALEQKVNSLVGGGWKKRFTDYTIEVYIQPNSEWGMSEELAETVVEGEINGYKIYQMKENNQIFLLDNEEGLFYTVICVDNVDYNNEQRDKAVREYINLMMRI